VFVSILPQAFLVERVGGSRLRVDVLVAPGQSPETYEPTPRQLAALSDAALFVRVGVPFEESLLGRLPTGNGELQIVEAHAGIARQQPRGASASRAGPPDPHLWLDPRHAATMAQAVADALRERDPAGAEAYQRNLHVLQRDLEGLDRELAAELAPVRGRKLFAYHGAYGYFCARYGLEQVALSLGDQHPGAKRVAEFVAEAERNGATVLFVQPQFSRRQAEAVAAQLGAEVVALDPLAKDYIPNMRRIARYVREGLSPRP
jgi:zinc transport system substrate-binding protein